MGVWGEEGENLPSRVNSKGKYPAAGANLTCSSKAATVSGVSKHIGRGDQQSGRGHFA